MGAFFRNLQNIAKGCLLVSLKTGWDDSQCIAALQHITFGYSDICQLQYFKYLILIFPYSMGEIAYLKLHYDVFKKHIYSALI